MRCDIAVIGAGILGVASALALQRRFPGREIVVLEREAAPAQHQSGRNSGVVHAGVYYPPGSLKARFCRRGAEALAAYCQRHALPFERCGKLIVATSPRERERLDALEQRARGHGLRIERLDAAALSRSEPAITGVAALRVPATAITDYRAVVDCMLEEFTAAGGRLLCATAVAGIRETPGAVHLATAGAVEGVAARFTLVCAGVMADRCVRLQGLSPDFAILPFRGEYYNLPAARRDLIRHLIYPVPDPALPFLGVHLTRHVDGTVSAGPNAVLAPGRHAYRGWRPRPRDLLDMARFPGTWCMLAREWRAGVLELAGSLSRRVYLRRLQRYCPQLGLDDLQPRRAGIRAQALDRRGHLLHDFLFLQTRRVLHVCNAPSPGATSALPIAEHLVEQVVNQTEQQDLRF